MRKILAEIQTGEFAKEWLLENRVGKPRFNAITKRQADTRSKRSASAFEG